MKTILLSFTPDWFDRLETGTLKFEYRKHFPCEETTVFFYVSSPVKAITGIAHCLPPETLASWQTLYKDRSEKVMARITDYLSDCRYAIPIASFQPTNRIELSVLKDEVPNFVVPRMYYYIDDTVLLDYLQSNIHPHGEPFMHSFLEVSDDEICC